MTAAHCLLDKGEQDTRLPEHSYFIVGKHNLESIYEKDYKVLQISKFMIHPNWRENTLYYDADIAVAILVLPIQFNSRIKPICLYPYAENSNDISGLTGVVAGYGYTEEQKLAQGGPRIVELPIINEDACIKSDSRLASVMSNRCFCTAANVHRGPCKVGLIVI